MIKHQVYTRRDSIYYWIVYHINGARFRQSLAVETTKPKRDAEAIARLFINQKIKELNNQASLDIADLVQKYLAHIELRNSRSTLRGKYRVLREFVKLVRGKRIIEIDKADVSKYLDSKLRGGAAAATYNRALATIRHMFNFAIENELLQVNPTRRIRKEKEEPRERFLSDAEIHRLLDVLRDISEHGTTRPQRAIYYMVLVALATGMRKSEIVNLRWMDYRDDAFIVRRKGTKKTMVPAPKLLMAELAKMGTEGEYIFDLRTRDSNSCSKVFRRACAEAKVRAFRFHDLRHSCATLATREKANPVNIQAILGHSSLSMTSNYAHSNRDDEKQIVENILKRILS